MHRVQAKALLGKWNNMNVYRGCQHGCVYCDSRSTCYQFSHLFEDVEVKENAPELLEDILRRRRKKCMIGSGSMADPYQPCEKELQLTQRCLEVIARFGFGATVITKSDLVLRDMELFERIHRRAKAVVQMTLTIADDRLSALLEPGVCNTTRRYAVLKAFQARGIPTVVWMTPLLPYLTDTRENVETLLDYCVDAGVKGIICPAVGVTLRDGDREYYYKALDRHFPGLSEVYRREYGNAYQVASPRNDELMQLFHARCEAAGILHDWDSCFAYTAAFPQRYAQTSLFD